MGSKKVKAVAVKGKAGNVPLFNADQAKDYRQTYLAQLTGHFGLLKEFGTPGIMAMMAKFGDSPGWIGYHLGRFRDRLCDRLL
jgi:aldehyde:ferredoxin oxidoreductase